MAQDSSPWPVPALLLGAVAIATSPIWVRLSELNPTTSAFQRVFLALPLLGAFAWFSRKGTPAVAGTPADHRLAVFAGLFFAGDLACWHWSIQTTSVTNATLLANFAPIFVTLGAWLLYRERMSRLFLLGMLAALAGAGVLSGVNLVVAPERLQGDALGLVTAVFYAAYMLSVARARRGLGVAELLFASSAVTALALLPLALLSPGPLWPARPEGWGVLLGLAWFSHAIGQGLIAYALAHLPTTFSSVGLLLQPLIAALLAWWLFAEAIGAWQAFGGAVIVFGIYLAKRGSDHQS